MSRYSFWEEAWAKAKPRLSEIQDMLGSPSPPHRIIRVGQLDAELLDQELSQLLQEPLNRSLSLISTSLRARFEPELRLLIHLVLYKLSIWNTGASYGAKLQDLRYTIPSTPGQSLAPSGLPRRTLLMHGAITLIIPYLHHRIRSHALSRAWPDAPSSDHRRKAWTLLTSLESSHTLLGLLNFILFLWDGRYRTTVDRILNLRLVPSRRLTKRDVSYEFMNRQMVWHAFTEFLLFLLPLVSARSIRRRFKSLSTNLSLLPRSLLSSRMRAMLGLNSNRRGSDHSVRKKLGKYWSLPQDQCAICAENASFNLNLSEPTNAFSVLAVAPAGMTSPQPTSADSDIEPPAYPIYTPYMASCGDIYCYHCIAERMIRVADDGEDQLGWECLRCGEGVKSAERHFIEEGSEKTSDYEFSSDMELNTDLSGSMGSYSEFGYSDDN
ncbi:Pex12 amino terminal region-domain-containing protein [Infundibulicybe gibba]|nr:Pex12 amino terminal region-domain-containing protein [Infundibulicybe gibba]